MAADLALLLVSASAISTSAAVISRPTQNIHLRMAIPAQREEDDQEDRADQATAQQHETLRFEIAHATSRCPLDRPSDSAVD